MTKQSDPGVPGCPPCENFEAAENNIHCILFPCRGQFKPIKNILSNKQPGGEPKYRKVFIFLMVIASGIITGLILPDAKFKIYMDSMAVAACGFFAGNAVGKLKGGR